MIIQMVEETCCKCGISFGITQGLRNDLVRCKNTFYCPKGHPQCYCGETDAKKYERKFKIARENLDYATKQMTHLRKSNSALRGVITRTKKK